MILAPIHATLRILDRLVSGVMIGVVRCYQLLVRPLLVGPTCRFYPTCSDYALGAVRTHGALRGGGLAVRRVCRCHPWNPGGYDPVPQRTVDAVAPRQGRVRTHGGCADTQGATPWGC